MEELAERIGEYAGVFLAAILAGLLGVVLFWNRLERSIRNIWKKVGFLWGAAVERPPLNRLRRRFPRFWAFWGRRLSPESDLGLYFTVALALIMMVLLLFFELAEGIGAGKEVARFDQALAAVLRRHTAPAALTFFFAVTQLANLRLITGLALAVGLLLVVRREWLLLAGWTAALAGGGLLNLELKAIYRRTRPALPNPFMTESGWSFPSGHAMGALIVYGMLAYLLVVISGGKGSRLILSAAAVMIVLIGASRMFLGVHYFSDVIAGYTAGIAWLAICIAGTEIARRRRQSRC
jgi:undecaprenyl-diphosphatase